MSLKKFMAKNWLRPHKTNKQEIGDLFLIVERDLKDSESSISSDWRFGIAYNAVLKLCTILLYASGFRSGPSSHHMRTIAMLPEILGVERKLDADYIDACRRKRNTVEYNYVGGASDADADELFEFTISLRADILEWLEHNHSEYL